MNRRKTGDRVYMLLVNDATGEERKEWGTVASDEGLWDYTDVVFDSLKGLTQAILSYYLFDDETPNSKGEPLE